LTIFRKIQIITVMKKNLLWAVLCLVKLVAVAQADSTAKPKLHVGGFLEAYYGIDAWRSPDHARPCFTYNHTRLGEVAINLALVQLSVTHDRYRANLGLMAGTYPEANLASEPGMLRFIYEANVGVALGKSGRSWLDMGVFPSYIGFEGPISTDNLTLSRSLIAESSPYYFSGARLSTKLGKRVELAGYLLNGWQRMRILSGNRSPSAGTQVRYQANDKLLVNWSTYVGPEGYGNGALMRYFSDLYFQAQPFPRLAVTGGFDLGFQQIAPDSTRMNHWTNTVGIMKYDVSKHFALVGRGESFVDARKVIGCGSSNHAFVVWGGSLGGDYHPQENVWLRVEARYLRGREKFFRSAQGQYQADMNLLASIAIRIP
jgi:Putative beta-barrel porin-2, OmpL-like. bbp2